MKYEDYRKAALDAALKSGCSAAETVFISGDGFSVSILEGEVDKYNVSRRYGMGLRVQFGGQDGYAYTEIFDNPQTFVDRAVDNARSVNDPDIHPMQTSQSYETITSGAHPVCDMEIPERIELAKNLELKAKGLDKRVERIQYSSVSCGNSVIHITNTLGLNARRENSYDYSYVAPVVKKDDDIRSGFGFRTGAQSADIQGCAEEAVTDGIGKLGAKPVPAGQYRILMTNLAMADFLGAFSPMFSAEQAQKGLSSLAGREGQKIGSDFLNITDDPFNTVEPREFDDEGTPSTVTKVVENGVFKSFLHNLKTARKAGCTSTSNAYRTGAGSPVNVAPSNFYIVPGNTPFSEMTEKLGDGLVINDVSGLHVGVNAVSGEFSLLSAGYLVKDGKRIRSVDQITIAGSFFDLMKSIEAVGEDLRFGLSSGSVTGSPSVLISGLKVAGK